MVKIIRNILKAKKPTILIKYLKIFLKLMSISLLVGIALLTLVFSIPNSTVEENTNYSLELIKKEGISPKPFFNTKSCMLDNHTDRMMLQKTIIQTELSNPVRAAMDANNYSRYWHGYQTYLRPLIALTTYNNIRYLNMFVLFVLIFLVFSLIKEKLNIGIAISFALASTNVCLFMVPFSMTFMPVFVVTFTTMCILLKNSEIYRNDISLFKMFLVIGILVSYFDLLTTPLITLGMPLAIIILLEIYKNKDFTIKRGIAYICRCSLSWVTGYSVFWSLKWVAGSLILRKNLFTDAKEQIDFRVSGNEEYPLQRWQAIKDNYELLSVSGDNLKTIIILLTIVFLILFIFFHKEFKNVKKIIPLFIISTFPYIWFYTLGNHSVIHSRFTYRIQIITLFSLLSSLTYIINWDKFIKYFRILFKETK